MDKGKEEGGKIEEQKIDEKEKEEELKKEEETGKKEEVKKDEETGKEEEIIKKEEEKKEEEKKEEEKKEEEKKEEEKKEEEKKEEEKKEEEKTSLEGEYKIDYYRGNISNLAYSISENIPLEKIPDCLKKAFLLDDSIYSDNYYFKGIFPKVISSTEGKDNKIKGICSFYYESNENLSENLIIRINSIFAKDDYKKQISMMIDFIKQNALFNRIEVYILYDKVENKFIPNQEAKEVFQQLGFKWACVVRVEKMQQRYIKLYYAKDEENKNYQNNFIMNTLSIVTVNNENNAYILKNIINTRSEDSELKKISYNKFINPFPVYSLLIGNTNIKYQFLNRIMESEIKEMQKKVWRFVISENGWNLMENEKKKIKNIQFDMKKSISDEIERYFMKKEIKYSCDLCQTKLSINFENNYSIVIDNIYYNKISTDKIKLLSEKKTNTTFFFIPSSDNTAFFYIAEVNKKLKDLLIDSSKNIYEKFLEFEPSTQQELIDFSKKSYRDITYIPTSFKKSSKTIYIPTFSIDTHIFSYDYRDVYKNIKMTDSQSNIPSYLTSVDEFININFKPDTNIEDCFSVVPVIGGKTDVIIKDSFIIGIFNNNIINENKLPLLQILYITKDNFLTTNNYFPGKRKEE